MIVEGLRNRTEKRDDDVPSNMLWIIRRSNFGIVEITANPIRKYTSRWRERSRIVTALYAATAICTAVLGGAIWSDVLPTTETRIDPQVMRDASQLDSVNFQRFKRNIRDMDDATRIIGTSAAVVVTVFAAGLAAKSAQV